MKKAFTLIELLVVIAIIGVLAGVLVVSFSGGTESARAAQCLANLKNLANACQAYGMEEKSDKIYPRARPNERELVTYEKGKFKTVFEEHKAWISWFSKGNYDKNGRAKSSQSNPTIGFMTTDKEKSAYALTNSCIWTYVSHNSATFVCPTHVKEMKKKGKPTWSYLMNSEFTYQHYGKVDRADRILLFSEIPFMRWHTGWKPDGKGSGTDDDAVLQYTATGTGSGEKGKTGDEEKSETIGANHMIGRDLYAHIAFADAHVEKLRIPYRGSSKNPSVDETELKNLTSWLCTGTDFSFDGKKYQKLTN